MARKKTAVWENTDNKPVSLTAIFEWALGAGRVNRILATERSSIGRSNKRSYKPDVRENAHRLFGEYLIKAFEARSWPGTELIGHTGRVYVATFDKKLATRIIAAEGELFNWLNSSSKKLVEDLCLFREGANCPIFASVTHEKDAYIVSAEAATVPGFEKTDYGIDEMLLAAEGEYFCHM